MLFEVKYRDFSNSCTLKNIGTHTTTNSTKIANTYLFERNGLKKTIFLFFYRFPLCRFVNYFF